MKFYCFLFLLLAFQATFACTLNEEGSSISYDHYIQIPLGGNTYQTAGEFQEKIGENGIETWADDQSEFSIYVKSERNQTIFLALDLLPQEADSELSISLDQSYQVRLEAGQSGSREVGKFQLKEGYNQFRLNGLTKSGKHFANIKNLIFASKEDLMLEFIKDNENNRFYWGRRGPSVHLTYSLPDSQNFKWFYNEVRVPEGQDPIGSYYMANGFGEGYFGIQVNGPDERRILFSVWSPFQTDDPTTIPKEEKILLLKKGDGVYTGEFGNEGSGGQSYLVYPWKAGDTYKFLNSVEPDGKGNTIYTAYFMDPEVGKWMLIASFLRPKTDTWYQRPHSFLENFIPESGNIQRSAHYSNQWARNTNGEWMELTDAKFTGDDIAKRGYRKDFAGGEINGEFFLQNGGFFNQNTELNSMHQRAKKNHNPQINWEDLP